MISSCTCRVEKCPLDCILLLHTLIAYMISSCTCRAEECPLDCILLKESACAPQKTAHTSLLTNITPPVRALKETLRCKAVSKTKCGNDDGNKKEWVPPWQQRGSSVHWVRAGTDKSAKGTPHVLSPLLPNNTGMLPSVGHAGMTCLNKPTTTPG